LGGGGTIYFNFCWSKRWKTNLTHCGLVYAVNMPLYMYIVLKRNRYNNTRLLKNSNVYKEICNFYFKPSIHDTSFVSKSPFKFLDRVYHTRNLNGWKRNASYFSFNLDVNWPIRRHNPYQHQFVNVNNNNYTCCAKMAWKEETPKCRKKTVTWTNEMIEDLIDFMEIHPIMWNVKDKSYHDKDKRWCKK